MSEVEIALRYAPEAPETYDLCPVCKKPITKGKGCPYEIDDPGMSDEEAEALASLTD